MTEHHFETPRPVSLYLELGSGRIRVEATETTQSHVTISGPDADRVVVDFRDNYLSVLAPRQRGGFGGSDRLDVQVTVPQHSTLATKTGSADLVASGDLAGVAVRSGSGDVTLESISDAGRIETGSGDISVADVRGELRIKSGSGSVALDSTAAEVTMSTGSGDVTLGRCEAAAQVKTGSGNLDVGEGRADVTLSTGSGTLTVDTAHRGRVTVKSASGGVRLGVPEGVPVWTDLSTVTGRISSTLPTLGEPAPGQDHVELRATTVSGDIALIQK